MAATAPTQKTSPTTEASCSSAFSTGGNASSRAAISAWTVSGTGMFSASGAGRSPSGTCGSNSIRTNSSAYSGLPPAFAMMADRVSAGSSVPSSSVESSVPVSSCVSGASAIVIEFRLPPPQPARRSSSSGRAAQMISSGTCPAHSTRCSMNSSSASSAHWRSSNSRTSGRSVARLSKKRRQAVNSSFWSSAAAASPASSPTSGARRLRIQSTCARSSGSASSAARSFLEPPPAGPSRGCPRARGRSPTAPRTSSPRRTAGTGPAAT